MVVSSLPVGGGGGGGGRERERESERGKSGIVQRRKETGKKVNIFKQFPNLISESVDSIIESVDSISRDEPDSPLTQYITNAGISRARYTITHFKHHHRVLRLISNRISV